MPDGMPTGGPMILTSNPLATMKKSHIALLCIALAALASSCQKEGLVRLTLSTSNYDGAGKLYVDDDQYSCWSNGDQVAINGTPYTVTATATSAVINGVAASESYAAVYPATIVTGSMAGSTINVTLPRVTDYVEIDGTQHLSAPMAAWTEGTDLQFHNLGSLLVVEVENPSTTDTLTMKRITATSGNAPLSGPATIAMGSHPSLTMTGSNDSCRSIILSFLEGSYTIAPNGRRSYYIPLPPFAEASKLTITVEANTPTSNYLKSKSQSGLTLPANRLAQGPSCTPDSARLFLGTGTSADPYLVENCNDLRILTNDCNTRTRYTSATDRYLLTHDITARNLQMIHTGYFNSEFDGNGHAITLANPASTTNNWGLFGNLFQNANIHHLTLKGALSVTVSGNSNYAIGTFCSSNSDNGKVDYCTSEIDVHVSTPAGGSHTGYLRVGGITGSGYANYCTNKGDILIEGNIKSMNIGGITGLYTGFGLCSHNRNEGDITAQSTRTDSGMDVGGIVGYRTFPSNGSSKDFTDNTNTGNLSGQAATNCYVGGIIAETNGNYGSTCIGCVNQGSLQAIAGTSAVAGGIFGKPMNFGIRNCYNEGHITATATGSGTSIAGGLLGQMSEKKDNTICNSYNKGTVTTSSASASTQFCCGIAGRITNLSLKIQNCYSSGALSTSHDAPAYGIAYADTLRTLANCYWLNSTASTGSNISYASNLISFDTDGALSSPVTVGSHPASTSLLEVLNYWKTDNGNSYSAWAEGGDRMPVFATNL